MRIVIAAHGLRTGGGISVGQNIIAALGRLAPDHHYLVTIPPYLNYEDVCQGLPRHETSVFRHGGNFARRYCYETQELPALVRKFGADAALCLGNTALQNTAIPQALLFQNSYYIYPRRHFGRAASWRLRLLVAVQRRQFARDLQNIRLLLCQTPVVAERVRRVYDYQGATLICPNAVSRFTLAGGDTVPATLPQPLARVAGKRRLFCLTAYYTHKNLEAVVDLFHQKKEALRDYAAILTIAPEQGAGATRLLERIRQLRLENSIINVGPLPQQDLAAYFAHCHALFMPTLLESFSGTYLEAMHFGLPILTSDLDFAHEVCGDAACYFDPWSLDAMAATILESAGQRDELIVKGRAWLSGMFRSWDSVGADMLNAVEGMAR